MSALTTLRTMLVLRVVFTVVPNALGIVGGRMGPISPPRAATTDVLASVIFYGLIVAVFVGLWFCRRWARTGYVVILALFAVAMFARPQPVFASTTLFAFILLQHVLDGAIIAMTYLLPLRERFTAKA